VTTEEARSLEDIFIDADFDRIVGGGGDTGVVALTFVPADRPGGSIALRALLPTGDLIPKPPG